MRATCTDHLNLLDLITLILYTYGKLNWRKHYVSTKIH